MSTEARIHQLLDKMRAGWRLGSGNLFAEPFADDARFVAFDGSVHIGPGEIAAFHQQAFETVLKGTSLDLAVTEIRQVDSRIWVVFANGWHRPNGAPESLRRAASTTVFVFRVDEPKAEVLVFQNTRVRPIRDRASAEIWKAFDASWEAEAS
jgi:uncharacterized protein (TIGR02246 family)